MNSPPSSLVKFPHHPPLNALTRSNPFQSDHTSTTSTTHHPQTNLQQASTLRPTPINLVAKPRNTCHFQPTTQYPYYHSRSENEGITTETLDDIINSILSDEERVKYESKLFLPLHDLIFPSNRPKRTATRSQNSFIIFRKDYQARITAEQGPEVGSRLKDISRSASIFWRNCSPEDKYMYDRIAACTKKLHDRMSPNYICKPMRKYDGHCGNGRIFERYSATFFMPISQDQRNRVPSSSSIGHTYSYASANRCAKPISNHFSNSHSSGNNDTYDSICLRLESIKRDSISHCQFRPSGARLQINSLSSYDKSLIESVDRNTRI
ncbi:10606_t:CDS:1 [Acaulospora colombiana]|uniref:10606_t:CDS:1 n=1 Tax=Acaulospora colombiana TaxID=27376 RepID=A0ACA9LHN0_9GLOM|nr:10606_t:CDS:1 [Acaulospora colombiana]